MPADELRVLRPEVRPVPTDEELAAIVAAIEVCWPRSSAPAGEPPPTSEPSRWRFAGRWWSKPVPLHRERPW
ncbi:MAG: hypothetical protein ACRD29_24025 [Acidimicrobiales bacterium]